MQCKQNGCEREATKNVYWPGQTTQQCDNCADKVIIMGRVMGIKVDTSPIIEQSNANTK